MVNSPRIIVSLDYPDMSAAMELAARLDPRHCAVKVGKELFTGNGPVVVEKLVGTGFRVFLDLKFHDIPNTVASACSVAADLGVWMLNIHAAGGSRMISAAREALDRFNQRPLLIAVTVLTSIGTDELAELGIHSTVEDYVLRLAHLAETAGIDGVVCSAQEAALLRKEFTDNFCLVTPGIRPKGTPAADQKRVLTPSEAIAAGSDYLVIGRPITQAPDPLKALESIENEVNAALALGGR